MKKTESNNLEEKMPIIKKLKENDGHSSKSRNLSQDQEKTLDQIGEEILGHPSKMGYYDKNDQWVEGELPMPEKTADGKHDYKEFIENAEIVNKSEVMDEIIKNNDKFETIRVLMEILCKELGISVESQFGEIHKALVGVTERYYKSMEDWKNLTKNGLKNDIRQ